MFGFGVNFSLWLCEFMENFIYEIKRPLRDLLHYFKCRESYSQIERIISPRKILGAIASYVIGVHLCN